MSKYIITIQNRTTKAYVHNVIELDEEYDYNVAKYKVADWLDEHYSTEEYMWVDVNRSNSMYDLLNR